MSQTHVKFFQFFFSKIVVLPGWGINDEAYTIRISSIIRFSKTILTGRCELCCLQKSSVRVGDKRRLDTAGFTLINLYMNFVCISKPQVVGGHQI